MVLAPPDSGLRLLPLGGLGQIGMNCLVLEQRDDLLVVDCGIRFPHDDLGVDVVHPDFGYVRERRDRLRGVFLTHGHEDHVGALPFLLREAPAPVFGPPHALGIAEKRLAEHGFARGEVDLRPVHAGDRVPVASFEVEPVRVAHSIVEASALALRTAAGLVVHTGDFDFDPDPPDGEPTDEARLEALGDEGVALLLSDSTNVDVPRHVGTERSVGESLDSIVARAGGAVFVALFASNVQRLLSLGLIAERHGRRLCLLGRSLGNHVGVATGVGRLPWRSHLAVSPAEARALPRNRLLVLAGGTQGEPASAMARLAAGVHSDLSVEPGDTVIFSSRVIPGNDLPVAHMEDALLRRGAIVKTRVTDPAVHTSGHASRDEQTRMLALLRPRCFLPVHGTLHHLTRHAALARELGVREVRVEENGAVLRLDGEHLTVEERLSVPEIAVGPGGVRLSPELLRARRDVSRAGVVVVGVALDAAGRVASAPSVVAVGVPGLEQPAAIRGLSLELVRVLEASARRRTAEPSLVELLRRTVRRHLGERGLARPILHVEVGRVGEGR